MKPKGEYDKLTLQSDVTKKKCTKSPKWRGKTMKKRLVALTLAVATLTSSIFTGCSSETAGTDSTGNQAATEKTDNPEGSSGKTTINIWFGSDAMEQKESIVAQFNEMQDEIEVVAAYYDTDGLKDALKIAASSNTLPDAWRTYGGSLGSYFVENDLCYDLTEYAEENQWDKKFNAGTLELCKYDGKLYGYPSAYNVITMWYRKDIFEQCGLEVPTTFEEFENVCAVLKENGVTPISTAGLYGWHVMRFVELLVEHYAGAEKHDQLNRFETSWNCEEVVQALTKYKEFCDLGYFPEGFVTADPDTTNYAVFSGQAAMDVDGQWFDSNIVTNEQNMDLYDFFAFPSGGTNRVSAFVDMFEFRKDISEQNLEACMTFLDYYLSDECVEQYPDAYNFPLPTIGADVPDGQPHVEGVFETSSENGTFTITDQAFPAEVADVLFNVQAAIANGEMTPEEGAAKIQEGIDSYFAAEQ